MTSLSLPLAWHHPEPSPHATAAGVEGDLVERAAGGDVEAFARLYHRYVARVYRHAYYRVGEIGEAEDITHQTFLQAWQAIGRFRLTGAPFVAWLLTIANNLVVDHYRRNPRGRLFDLVVTAEDLIDESADLDRQLDQARVFHALRQLRPDQQRIITMRLIEDLDYPEIALAIGKTEGNVRVILHRSLSALRKLLEAAA
jgi:RNA polymerase sigma-70 factor (ECF subfamily)